MKITSSNDPKLGKEKSAIPPTIQGIKGMHDNIKVLA